MYDKDMEKLEHLNELLMSEEELKSFKEHHNGETPTEVEKNMQDYAERVLMEGKRLESPKNFSLVDILYAKEIQELTDAQNLGEIRIERYDKARPVRKEKRKDIKNKIDSTNDLNKLAAVYESLMSEPGSEKGLQDYKNSHNGKSPTEYERGSTVANDVNSAPDKRIEEYKTKIKDLIDLTQKKEDYLNQLRDSQKQKEDSARKKAESTQVMTEHADNVSVSPNNGAENKKVGEIRQEFINNGTENKKVGEIREENALEIMENGNANSSDLNPLYLDTLKYEQNHTFIKGIGRVWNSFSSEKDIEDAFFMAALAIMASPLTMAADELAHLVEYAKNRDKHFLDQKKDYNSKNLKKFMEGTNGQGLSKYGIEPPKCKEEYSAVLFQLLDKKVKDEMSSLKAQGLTADSGKEKKIRKDMLAEMCGEVFNRAPEELTRAETREVREGLKTMSKLFENKDLKRQSDDLKTDITSYNKDKDKYNAEGNRIRQNRSKDKKNIMNQFRQNRNEGNAA
jgi:hypothetical protein